MVIVSRGFTLVELLIVIVVIGILASITLVAYNGVQQKATQAMLSSDLVEVAKAVEIYRGQHGAPPSDLATVNISNSNGVTYDYAAQSGAYCASATSGTISEYVTNSSTPMIGDCSVAFVKWSPTGAVTYNPNLNEIVLSTSGSGNAVSPLIPNNNAASATISLQMYATVASPHGGAGQSCVYLSSAYYASDGVTPVKNTAGYTANGNAGCYPLNAWATHSWTTATGPNVAYVKFVINDAPTSYTSDNVYRNVSVTTN
ncbi:MAG TPA: prepilin-type N-terminal cleavage/methylation domain-containing protein [Candidatus Saccharimonadaceae bacterium]|nr:prepilin-type N-terminal cleavage/methylation domain-containing protein [Candidatus Saccharimonadaceae bacterium]